MYHTVAFSEVAVTATLEDLTPVPDSIMSIQNGHFLLQYDYDLLFAAVMATDIQRARVNMPSLRQITLPWIRPLQAALIGGSLPGIADYRSNAIRLARLEELAVEALQDAGANQRITAILGISRQRLTPIPAGNVFTMRGTSTTAATANAWSLLAVTWQDVLPAGRYAAVGLIVDSANGQAARLVFEDQVERPGTISIIDESNIESPIFTKGRMGVLGYFDANRMPNIEVLANAADAVHTCYLDFIRVS